MMLNRVGLIGILTKAVEEKWEGGIEGYVKTELGLSESEVQAVKNGLKIR